MAGSLFQEYVPRIIRTKCSISQPLRRALQERKDPQEKAAEEAQLAGWGAALPELYPDIAGERVVDVVPGQRGASAVAYGCAHCPAEGAMVDLHSLGRVYWNVSKGAAHRCAHRRAEGKWV